MNELKNYMVNLSVAEYGVTKDKIVGACKVSNSIWLNWLNGRTRVPALAKQKINEVTNYQIFKS